MADHAARGPLRRQPGALEVGIDDVRPAILVDLQRGAGLGHARVVDEHGDRTEALLRPVQRALDAVGVGHIHDDIGRLAIIGADRRDARGERLLPACREGHARASFGETAREVPAEPAGGAGDQDVPSIQTEEIGHGVSSAPPRNAAKCASMRSTLGSNPVNSRKAWTAWNTAIPPPSSVRQPRARERARSSVSNGK